MPNFNPGRAARRPTLQEVMNPPKPKTKKVGGIVPLEPKEHDEQVALFRRIRAPYEQSIRPDLQNAYAVPNGLRTTQGVGIKAKQEGLEKGCPDICCASPHGGYHGIYIEMKRQVSGSPSVEQKDWIRRLRKSGYLAVICHGEERAWELLTWYLDLPPTPTQWDGLPAPPEHLHKEYLPEYKPKRGKNGSTVQSKN